MKTPEEYLKEQKIDDFLLKYMSGMTSPDGISGNYKERIYKAIKAAQIDAINETVQLCAENADFGICQNDNGCPCMQESHFIDRDSILNCAKILIDKL